MFTLVALMCLYLGGNNIRKAFALAPFSQWVFINWALLVIGILLVTTGVLCVLQAMKDYKNMEAEKSEKAKAEKKKRQQQFFYDDEFSENSQAESEISPETDEKQ